MSRSSYVLAAGSASPSSYELKIYKVYSYLIGFDGFRSGWKIYVEMLMSNQLTSLD